jgi:hypothetical protein
MSVLAEQPLEGWSLKAQRTHGPPDSDTNEERRAEPSAGLDSIHRFDKIGGVIAPAIVAPGEEGSRHGIETLPARAWNISLKTRGTFVWTDLRPKDRMSRITRLTTTLITCWTPGPAVYSKSFR